VIDEVLLKRGIVKIETVDIRRGQGETGEKAEKTE
jgi:hypothetical protein